MRFLPLLFIPMLLFGATYKEIIQAVDHSLQLKSAKELKDAALKMYESAEGKNYPSLEASLTAYRLKETPTITFYPPGVPPQTAPMGTKSNFQGALSLRYPLFSGFAISGYIDVAKLQSEKAKLEVDDLKRNLYLNATKLATSIVATTKTVDALKKAKEATAKALQKAQGLFDNGLIPPSELYNIKAKSYQIDASLTELQTRKKQLLNTLSYLLNTKIDSIELPKQNEIRLEKASILSHALTSREDLLALKAALGIEKAKTTMAKSANYPTLALTAELKRQGDTMELNGNGYTNADQSYIGASLRWNIFNGFSDKKKIEASRLHELSIQTKINDYKAKIAQEIENAFLELHALKSKLKSAQMETKAKEEYYNLTFGRFENQLASADELSRSIADLAKAKAKTASLQAQIFKQYQTILLLSGNETFLRVNSPTAQTRR